MSDYLHELLLTLFFYTRSVKGKPVPPWFLSYDLVIKIMSRPNSENVPCYGFCHLSFDVDDISNYPWRFKWTSAMNRVKRLAGDPRTGHITPSHMTSSYVTKNTSITPHRTELEMWAMSHCVRLVMPHRLICNITTWINHLVMSFSRPNVKFSDWPFGVEMYTFDVSRHEESDGVLRFSLYLFVQKWVAKTFIVQKSIIFYLTCPRKVKMWPRIIKLGVYRFRTF